MQLRQMQYFVTVVQLNSFTEAAEACFISQSAISQQIQALEKELGVSLLLRQGRRFSLTEAGTYFYQQSLKLMDEVESIEHETRRIGSGNRQLLRIGYLRSWGGAQIKEAVASFSLEHPDIDLTLMTGTHEELYEALTQNTIDLAFNDHRRVFSPQYVNLTVTTAFTYAELSAQSPLVTRAHVTLEALRDVPCILIAPRAQRSHEQDYYQTTLGFSGTFLFAEDLEAARILVAANRGFLPIEGIAGRSEGGDGIHRIPIFQNGEQIARDYGLFWKKANDLTLCHWFADTLVVLF